MHINEGTNTDMEYIAFFIVTVALGYIAVRCALND